MKEKRKGLIIVFTGEGKGKTTAALGMALRAAGHDLKVIMIQFIKGTWEYGELDAVKDLNNLKIYPMGKGYILNEKDKIWHRDRVLDAWELGKKEIESKKYDMVILDEINYAIHYDLLSINEVIDFLKNKPEEIHVVLTGRDAKPELIEIADLVTEMKNIKHPYQKGEKAEQGIEY